VLPLQQPLGHELESHLHWPVAVTHSVPGEHPPHETPPAPQVLLFSLASGTQLVPLQQPAQDDDVPHVHTPLAPQVCPEPHGAHVLPPVPHEPGPCAP